MYFYYDTVNNAYVCSSKELINENLIPMTEEEYNSTENIE